MVFLMGSEPTDKNADRFSLLGYMVDENILLVDGERWNLIEDYTLENEEGEPKRFEYALKHHSDNDKQILLATGDNGYANISYFCNNVRGIRATFLGLIIGNSPTLNEKNFASISGVTLLSSAKISFSSGRVRELSKRVTSLFRRSEHTRHKARRRSRAEVIGDILSLLNEEGGLSITKIIYKCNLNYPYAVQVLDYLISKRLLLLNDLGTRRIFRITDDGKDLLNKLSVIDL